MQRSLYTLLLAATLIASLSSAANETDSANELFKQRNLYAEVVARLRQGQTSNLQSQLDALDGYVLRPYVDYHRYLNRLSTTRPETLTNLYQQHSDIPAIKRLYRRWLKQLGARRQWRTLRDHYTMDATNNDAELHCYFLRSLYGTGSKEAALDATTDIWLQPRSQPKACDPLFDVWRDTPRFTEDVAWQRLAAAIEANERSLARYLTRYLTGTNKTAAEAFYAVHTVPTRITRTNQYRADNSRYRRIILHGIQRLATRDAEKADKAWRRYARSHKFSDTQREQIEEQLIVELAKTGRYPRKKPSTFSTEVAEQVADAALSEQNWPEALEWMTAIDAQEANKRRWRYWQARASSEEQSDLSGDPITTLENLAGERQYYGFLAANRLGLLGQMNAAPQQDPTLALRQLRKTPGIARSIELFAVGDDINGRREWYQALDTLTREQQTLAAELAHNIGRVTLAIRTANLAKANDYLHLRFPMPYLGEFRQASHRTGVATALLFAIARQESAFDRNARSTANARGLMQLLPSTARLVARRARTANPSDADLYNAETNIRLGSFHLAWLLERYGGQAPLAIAAYNAGEHRVDRWIKDQAGVPMDIWIETIPFRETRNYVKNVLAFRHVYATLLQAPRPVLARGEQRVGAWSS